MQDRNSGYNRSDRGNQNSGYKRSDRDHTRRRSSTVKGRVNIQDQFLNQVRKERIPLTFKLINGEEFEGKLNSFDLFSLVIKKDAEVLLLYKHSVASIGIAKEEDTDKIELF